MDFYVLNFYTIRSTRRRMVHYENEAKPRNKLELGVLHSL